MSNALKIVAMLAVIYAAVEKAYAMKRHKTLYRGARRAKSKLRMWFRDLGMDDPDVIDGTIEGELDELDEAGDTASPVETEDPPDLVVSEPIITPLVEEDVGNLEADRPLLLNNYDPVLSVFPVEA